MYGGTKTEMQRLIKDSSALTDIQKELGVTVDANDMSFGNIVNAISVMQKKLEITGTTSKEASETLTGSMNAMKSAWKNLLANLSTGRDLKQSLNALLKTTLTFVTKNFIPMVGNVFKGLPEVFAYAFQEGIPQIIKSGTDMLNSLADGIKTGLPTLIEQAYQSTTTFVNGILQGIPQLLEAGGNLLSSLIQSIDLQKVLETGVNFVVSLGQGIINAIPKALSIMLGLVGQLFNTIVNTDWIACGKMIIQGVIDGLGALWEMLKEAVMNIVNWIAEQFVSAQKAIAESEMNNLYYSDRSTWEQLNSTSNRVSNGNQTATLYVNNREVGRLQT